MELVRWRKTEERMRKQDQDCRNHILCSWMKRYEYERREGERVMLGYENIDVICKRECEKVIRFMEDIIIGILKTKRETLLERMVMTFGGLELDEDEISFCHLAWILPYMRASRGREQR